MIITEKFTINDTEYIRTYSDKGVKIHGGFPEADYEEATDPTELHRTYTETDIPIESDSDAEEIVNILTGVSE
jgi:hypothetical protein